MKHAKQLLAAATMVALSGLYGCGSGDETNIVFEGNTDGGTGSGGGSSGGTSQNCPTWSSARSQIDGVDVCQLPSSIEQDRVLTSDIIWFMADRVTVGNGNREMSDVEGVLENGADVLNVTLTIEQGTSILGQAGSFANLIITRGSKINAVGTAAAPIIFSSSDDDMMGTGEWGGLIIHGYGLHNECPATGACNIDSEGESGFAGGRTADDDSGTLRYVVVTEGGYEFSPGDEINGISLVAVGSGTEMSYIQVDGNADDGVEFYGGSVSAKYIVLTNNLDDSVDWDEGWQGNLQYVLVIQGEQTEGNSIEADTEGSATGFLSKPTVANATFVGDGTKDTLWVFKQRSGGFLLNTIGAAAPGFTGLTNCVQVDGAGAEANIGVGLVFNNVIGGCAQFSADANDAPLGATGFQLLDPALNANWQPTGAAAAAVPLDVAGFNATYSESTADEAYLDATDYYGAVDPNATSFWYEGWTVGDLL